ncbi:MAG: GTP-binding protein, partial [Cyanobacteria bacterium J06649_12]
MIFDGKVERPWKTEEARKNELIFIGRNLDEAELKAGFKACLV